MRQNRAMAPGAVWRQDAAGVPAPPLRSLRPPRPLARNWRRAFARACSTHPPSRINRNSLKTDDRGTLYPSQNRRVLFPRETRNLRPPSPSAKSTSRGFLSRKELECNRFESQTWEV